MFMIRVNIDISGHFFYFFFLYLCFLPWTVFGAAECDFRKLQKAIVSPLFGASSARSSLVFSIPAKTDIKVPIAASHLICGSSYVTSLCASLSWCRAPDTTRVVSLHKEWKAFCSSWSSRRANVYLSRLTSLPKCNHTSLTRLIVWVQSSLGLIRGGRWYLKSILTTPLPLLRGRLTPAQENIAATCSFSWFSFQSVWISKKRLPPGGKSRRNPKSVGNGSFGVIRTRGLDWRPAADVVGRDEPVIIPPPGPRHARLLRRSAVCHSWNAPCPINHMCISWNATGVSRDVIN